MDCHNVVNHRRRLVTDNMYSLQKNLFVSCNFNADDFYNEKSLTKHNFQCVFINLEDVVNGSIADFL